MWRRLNRFACCLVAAGWNARNASLKDLDELLEDLNTRSTSATTDEVSDKNTQRKAAAKLPSKRLKAKESRFRSVQGQRQRQVSHKIEIIDIDEELENEPTSSKASDDLQQPQTSGTEDPSRDADIAQPTSATAATTAATDTEKTPQTVGVFPSSASQKSMEVKTPSPSIDVDSIPAVSLDEHLVAAHSDLKKLEDDVAVAQLEVDQMKSALDESLKKPSIIAPPSVVPLSGMESTLGAQAFTPDAADEELTPLQRVGHVAMASIVGEVIDDPKSFTDPQNGSFALIPLAVSVQYAASDVKQSESSEKDLFDVRCYGETLCCFCIEHVKKGYLVHAFGHLTFLRDSSVEGARGSVIICVAENGGGLTIVHGIVPGMPSAK